jgi:hypothetical protein
VRRHNYLGRRVIPLGNVSQYILYSVMSLREAVYVMSRSFGIPQMTFSLCET